MKKLILFILLPFLGLTQVKGIETKDTLSFYEMFLCNCPCLVYDNLSKTYDYHYSFYDINNDIGDVEVDTIYNKLVKVLTLNDLDITKPSKVIATSSQIDVKQIKKGYRTGNIKEGRYNYNKGDYLICFIYNMDMIELFIYEDPYKNKK